MQFSKLDVIWPGDPPRNKFIRHVLSVYSLRSSCFVIFLVFQFLYKKLQPGTKMQFSKLDVIWPGDPIETSL